MNLTRILDMEIEKLLLVITMVLMVFLIFFQAVSRYVLGSSLSWGSELALYLHIWQVWLGASLGIRMSEHVRIEVLLNVFPQRVKYVLNMIGFVCWFFLALFLAIKGTEFLYTIFDSGQKSPGLQVPMFIPYIVIPLSGLLMCIRLIQQMVLTTREEFRTES